MRNKLIYVVGIFCLVSLGATQLLQADFYHWMDVGSAIAKVLDSGHQSETATGTDVVWYYFDRFTGDHELRNAGVRIGVKGWTDETGTYYPVKLAGAPYGSSDEEDNMFAIPDEEGITVHKYWRYQPPSIVVDGQILSDPFPLEGEEVAPEKIPGTADVMIESNIRTDMGVSIHQRVLGWSQKYHDDYVVYDWVLTNTGNVDRDDEIELPDQTLDSLYFMRSNGFQPSEGSKEWSSWYGCRPGDTLRINYSYPHRSKGSTYDNFGAPVPGTGFLEGPEYLGEVMLHADTSPTNDVDNFQQPQMHCIWSYRILALKHEWGMISPAERELAYEIMKYGTPKIYGTPYIEDAYPGTFHEVAPDNRGYKFIDDFPGWGSHWHSILFNSSGPYTLAPGESIRFVWATVWGSISPEKAWEVGTDWQAGNCQWDGPDKLPPQYPAYPSLYDNENDWAKDNWVATGKDSLFINADASQWNVKNNYEVPIAPPPPSIEVSSKPDKIALSWGAESEAVSDFAGYRVYRSRGAAYPTVEEGRLTGTWERIFECGEGTDHPEIVHSYDDADADRGQAYFYYVTAFDDAESNIVDVTGTKESLESGKFLNRTTQPAHLTREPSAALSDIRVVPNPYNINATELQYSGEPDKIMFLNLPPVCTIKIYNESGDLMRTIEHTDGSGDEAWGDLLKEHSTTRSGQIVVSGLYLAYIETPEGEHHIVKFAVVR